MLQLGTRYVCFTCGTSQSGRTTFQALRPHVTSGYRTRRHRAGLYKPRHSSSFWNIMAPQRQGLASSFPVLFLSSTFPCPCFPSSLQVFTQFRLEKQSSVNRSQHRRRHAPLCLFSCFGRFPGDLPAPVPVYASMWHPASDV